VEILVSVVVEQGQVLETVVCPVAVEVMDVQPLGDRPIRSFPNDAMFQVACPIGFADADISLLQRPLTTLPVVMVLPFGVAETEPTDGAVVGVNPAAFGSLVSIAGQTAVTTRLPGPGRVVHFEMVAH
jgi:hypothetical protein